MKFSKVKFFNIFLFTIFLIITGCSSVETKENSLPQKLTTQTNTNEIDSISVLIEGIDSNTQTNIKPQQEKMTGYVNNPNRG